MWKVKIGYRAPLCCTLLVFSRAGGKCFMPTVVVHQANEYSRDIHHNVPFDWNVHHTPSGCMDRYWWLKVVTQFSNICGASPVKNYILFFDGHDSHFDDRALTHTQSKNIMPPVIIHQAKEYSEDIHHNIPLDWTVHHTSSGYMDKDGWLKAMTHSPTYVVPPLSTIRYSSSMDTIVTLTTAP